MFMSVILFCVTPHIATCDIAYDDTNLYGNKDFCQVDGMMRVASIRKDVYTLSHYCIDVGREA